MFKPSDYGPKNTLDFPALYHAVIRGTNHAKFVGEAGSTSNYNVNLVVNGLYRPKKLQKRMK